jgi:outer membrane biosynthesis protein TonB
VEQFNERLARLAELSDDELESLETELVAAFDAADDRGDIEGMQTSADALDKVREAKKPAVPVAEAAPPAAAPVGAAAEDTPETPTPAPQASDAPAEPAPEPAPAPEPVPEPEQPEAPVAPEPAEPAAPEPAETETPQPEAVAASGTTHESEDSVEEKLTADEVPEANRPVVASVPAITIRAGGDIPGLTAGSSLEDMDAVIEAMTRKVNAMRGVSGDGEHIIVASLRVEDDVPDGRTLRAGDLNGNQKKIRQLLGDQEALQPQALIAAGWCAPRSPIYEVPTMGTSVRPVRDSLPTFNAERGGVTWMQPPALPNMGGIGLWRFSGSAWESFDTPNAGDSAASTKPCFTVPCGTEQGVDVDAVTLCLNFFNMTARAFPEWIRGNTDLTMVAQARFAEQVLLSKMFSVTASGSCGTPGTQVGAARDFLLTVQTAAAGHRWRNRLGATAPLQLLAPAWVRDAIAVDLGLQQPGDNTLTTSAGEVDGYFGSMNVNPIWYIDDVPGTAGFVGCAFPAVAHWLLYPTGSFVRLDNGDLNLGVVRDKADVQANTYSEFSETFEAVAYFGPAAPNLWVVRGLTPIDIAGSSGAARAITIA